jgi:beta-glucosidase
MLAAAAVTGTRRRGVEAAATRRITAGSPMAGAGLFGLVAARPGGTGDGDRRGGRGGAAADVAVVVVGLTAEQETEAVDKTTLRCRRAGRAGVRGGGGRRRTSWW